MAIFGVPQAHEDDPIRAIKVAREIHQLVDTISPEVEKKIGQSISMHTGINTGLVVTGEVNMERGTHGIAGDTINLASRLSNLANPGEILVDVDTCRQVEGQFTCKYMETTTVKGKAEPVQVHKVLSQRDKPKPSLSIMAKNIGFLVKNVPFASKKAEKHFNKAIELFKEIGMKGYLGVAHLSLGLLYKASKRTDQARQCLLEAINLFQDCEAETYLKQANEALDSLV
jgi:tetratricopeptide (TPR) repeat protein